MPAIIHTLGPEAPDSCRAAQYYLNKHAGDIRIELHDCFETIIEHLNNYQGHGPVSLSNFEKKVIT